MKALAIDSATTKLTLAAKNDDKIVTASFDIGMKQSETLLPGIQYVLEKAELTPSDLDYTVISEGPGSFTGLRLGFSALKAFQVANKTPIYGICTLDAYANPFLNFGKTVISVIDAKKERFYAKGFSKDGNVIFDAGDYEPEKIIDFIKNESEVFVAGFDAEVFIDASSALVSEKKIPLKFNFIKLLPNPTDSLFLLAENKIKNGEPALKDFDGPVYLRASEAEVKAGQN